jgi:hypothetical protein
VQVFTLLGIYDIVKEASSTLGVKMKTLLATAEPADRVLPIMIVDSTPQQRARWHVVCQMVGVRHHFVGVESALGRLREGFSIAGLIVDHDLSAGTESTEAKARFLEELVEVGYRGPLVGANLLPDGWQQLMLQYVARRMGLALLVDDHPGMLTYDEMLRWCIEHH